MGIFECDMAFFHFQLSRQIFVEWIGYCANEDEGLGGAMLRSSKGNNAWTKELGWIL